MFRFLQTLAHAGEEHADSVESVTHFIEPWYIAIPTFVAFIAILSMLIWLLSGKRSDIVMIIMAFVLLVCGFTVFNISAIVSVISITAGFILSGFMAFGGLAAEGKDKKK